MTFPRLLAAVCLLLLLVSPALAQQPPAKPAPATVRTGPAAATTSPPSSGATTAGAGLPSPPSSGVTTLGAATPQPDDPAADPPGEAPAASSSPAAAPEGVSHAQLLDLHKRVDDLKERIRQSHVRLRAIQADVLGSRAGAAKLKVRFDNRLSGLFRLTRVLVVLDGAAQLNRNDQTDKQLADSKSIDVLDQTVEPGAHTVQILLGIRGNGSSLFPYLDAYRFTLRGSHSFTLNANRTAHLRITIYEKGSLTTPFAERLAVRFSIKER